MTNQINNILIQNVLWFEFKEDRISLRFNGFPENVHLTISFNQKSQYVNFHVSKNISGKGDKPKIYISHIDRVELIDSLGLFSEAMFRKMLQPVNLKRFHRRYGKSKHFISCEQMEQDKDSYSKLENDLLGCFKKSARIIKRKIVISKDIEGRLIKFFCSEELKSFYFEKIKRFTGKVPESINSFFLITKRKAILFVRFQGQWFIMRNDLTIVELLSTFIKPDILKHLIYKTLRAIKKIEVAETLQDVQIYNHPMWLFIEQTG